LFVRSLFLYIYLLLEAEKEQKIELSYGLEREKTQREVSTMIHFSPFRASHPTRPFVCHFPPFRFAYPPSIPFLSDSPLPCFQTETHRGEETPIEGTISQPTCFPAQPYFTALRLTACTPLFVLRHMPSRTGSKDCPCTDIPGLASICMIHVSTVA